ncbi:methyltransferase domain-containing protein [Bradyrhizobium sp. Arg237L]|uniref:methyltransferase domain-containing protein n=1 Tax=Bradyrhizobium sp. Arg237L TaxID=3003352 RepID=UPI00249E1CA6|nr:methyltransferase domain-containing protein [Bradyrhizobium sp. Arg237L]MDI4238459.1 methyltransferase domain-containing protein [Bradyrhizobium sp. Arg237L]
MLQADNLRPITTRLLREIGLAQGMRVVDLGCGAGDVAMLAAEMVGPTGAVVGIDRNAAAIATARERAPPLVTPISNSWKAMPPE